MRLSYIQPDDYEIILVNLLTKDTPKMAILRRKRDGKSMGRQLTFGRLIGLLRGIISAVVYILENPKQFSTAARVGHLAPARCNRTEERPERKNRFGEVLQVRSQKTDCPMAAHPIAAHHDAGPPAEASCGRSRSLMKGRKEVRSIGEDVKVWSLTR
jgi:hypothetical protein